MADYVLAMPDSACSGDARQRSGVAEHCLARKCAGPHRVVLMGHRRCTVTALSFKKSHTPAIWVTAAVPQFAHAHNCGYQHVYATRVVCGSSLLCGFVV